MVKTIDKSEIIRKPGRLYWDMVNELMYCYACAKTHPVTDYQDSYLEYFEDNSEVLRCDGCGKDLSKHEKGSEDMEKLVTHLVEALVLAKEYDCGWQVTEAIVSALRAVKRTVPAEEQPGPA